MDKSQEKHFYINGLLNVKTELLPLLVIIEEEEEEEEIFIEHYLIIIHE